MKASTIIIVLLKRAKIISTHFVHYNNQSTVYTVHTYIYRLKQLMSRLGHTILKKLN